jgi:hypothetical protein
MENYELSDVILSEAKEAMFGMVPFTPFRVTTPHQSNSELTD